jgi:hypothetical protein
MKIELPPIPANPYYTHDGDWTPLDDLFDEKQLREYAISAVMAERERCTKIATEQRDKWLDDEAIGACDNIAKAIRNQGEPT